MSGYHTIREKLPREGEEVLLCTTIGGVFRMQYVGGRFLRRDERYGDVVIDPKAVLKWKYPE